MRIVQPVRVERSYTQKLTGTPEEVFPLLCPVRETEWVDGWEPEVVYTWSGVAEEDCVFLTGEDYPESYWLMTERNPETFRTVLVKVTPGMTVGKFTIVLRENDEGGTDARVTYMYTALSEQGAEFVRNYTEDYYAEFMKVWETTLNEYLLAGRTAARGETPPSPGDNGSSAS
jgi:hypothetical protein